MNSYLSSATAFLVETVFGIYMMLVLVRLLLQLARADFYNPVCQFIVKATNPPLKPLRRVIPGLMGIDMAAVVLLLALQMLKLFLIALAAGMSLSFAGLLVMSIGELIAMVLNLYMISILIQIVLSWVGQGNYTPLTSLLYTLNEPVMQPARRILPPMSGIDLSPILVFLAIGLIKILVVSPIINLGGSLA
ncbi:MAG: YggT family protein [Pseudomonadota bacterium]|nr:YggT family protein [Pseudomonadota bacterium]